MQHPSRRAAWLARNVDAIAALVRHPEHQHLAPAALAARLELRRRGEQPARIDQLVDAAVRATA